MYNDLYEIGFVILVLVVFTIFYTVKKPRKNV